MASIPLCFNPFDSPHWGKHKDLNYSNSLKYSAKLSYQRISTEDEISLNNWPEIESANYKLPLYEAFINRFISSTASMRRSQFVLLDD